ncbi:HlyD family efflux transporter periplasmic adaptor subunit [Moraxella canis]|uniref:RND efflux pump membrane fusion protein barrel-sandwich domain-containing protein n=1 Tax=Moraxella canis TaxID=90239 RepID=A0A1S9ZKT0_9GAMM|nr:HlyD family efflux transporter periplasmic adaptor subunit [Moraxella canis]OOR84135.1 hypothetical protein B0180_04120 [Moraxella canis]WQE03308.1 hypothetical protein U0021_05930 [Moraxella canis]
MTAHKDQSTKPPKTRLKNPFTTLSVIAALTMGVAVSACSDDRPNPPTLKAADDGITLDKDSIMTVKMSKYQPSFAFDGKIIPANQASLSLDTAATVEHIFVDAGDDVSKDDVLLSYLTHLESSPSEITALHAPFDGMIHAIFAHADEHYDAKTPLVEIYDISQLKFISHLSSALMDYIKLGDAVTFGIDGVAHVGQISQVNVNEQNPQLIEAHVIIALNPDETPKDLLGRRVVGHIDYGQIQVGVMMPRRAVYDRQLNILALDGFDEPPHKPDAPIDGYVWVVKQDHRLSLSPVKILEYHPKTEQFLVQGITEDSLVTTATLPKEAHDKQVTVR